MYSVYMYGHLGTGIKKLTPPLTPTLPLTVHVLNVTIWGTGIKLTPLLTSTLPHTCTGYNYMMVFWEQELS